MIGPFNLAQVGLVSSAMVCLVYHTQEEYYGCGLLIVFLLQDGLDHKNIGQFL